MPEVLNVAYADNADELNLWERSFRGVAKNQHARAPAHRRARKCAPRLENLLQGHIPNAPPSDIPRFAKLGVIWHPEEAVSREQALKMLTRWPVFAAFEELDKGSIEVGKLADLTILSDDIMKIPEPDILRTRCLMTVVGGEIVYDSGEIGTP